MKAWNETREGSSTPSAIGGYYRQAVLILSLQK